MKTILCDQGSDSWFKARIGRPSASCFDKIITTQGKRSKQRDAYMAKIASEIVTGKTEETYQNGAMSRGIELEPEARSLFEMITDCTVDQVGLCVTDDDLVSCSPDGIISEHSGIEIKCPSASVHVSYLLKGKVPTDYYCQVQGSMYVTGRCEWYFMSYYPGLKPLIVKSEIDEDFQKSLHEELMSFCDELKKLVDLIRA